jgi:hypothetical protein
MRSRPIESSRGAVRWILPTALLALTPKCLLCVAAYAGIGALLGLGGPEICGAPDAPQIGWALRLALMGVGLGTSVALARCRARRSALASVKAG